MSAFLINPSDVIHYDRTDDELELFFLFCAVVAGKTATTQARLLNRFLLSLPSQSSSPFARISSAIQSGVLLERLIESRLGQFNRLVVLFEQALAVNLRTCSISDLEQLRGVGPKTARMFVMMSRPDQRVAALDTHVLKWLNNNGIAAPKTTPSAGPIYEKLENEFLKLVDKSGMSVAEYDLMVWRSFAET